MTCSYHSIVIEFYDQDPEAARGTKVEAEFVLRDGEGKCRPGEPDGLIRRARVMAPVGTFTDAHAYAAMWASARGWSLA